MFSLGTPVAEAVLRPIIIYFFLLAALRLAGKRELGQLNPGDLVVLLTLSNALQNAIIGNDISVTGGIISATTLLAFNSLVTRLTYHRTRVRQVVEGEPATLVKRGEIVRKTLSRELITEAELLAALRRQGINRVDDVEAAILETSGTITVFAREPTPQQVVAARMQEQLDRIERKLDRPSPAVGPVAGST